MLKNIHNTLLALAFIPMLATPTIGLNIVSSNSASSNTVAEVKENSDSIAIIRKINADKLDKYFSERSMPLEGYGMQFILIAEKYGLPYNFLPAISAIESSGGKAAYNNNPFGWGSAKIPFKDFNEAIEVVGKNLGGANPNTVKYYSSNDIKDKLWHYNESVVRGYTEKVISAMNKIDSVSLNAELASK